MLRSYQGIIILFVGSLYFFYDSILIVFPSVFINDLMYKFSIGATGISMFSAVYFYSYAPLQMFNGILINKFGPRKIIVFGLCICVLGLVLFMTSNKFLIGCIGRGLMGVGASAGYIAPMVLAVNWFERKYYVILTGFIVLVECLGAVFGQIGLLLLAHISNMRYTILSLIIGGITLCALTYFVVKDFPTNICKSKPHTLVKFNCLQFFHVISNKYYLQIAVYATLLWSPIAIFASLWGVNFMHEVCHISKLTATHLLIAIWCGIGIGGPIVGVIANVVKNKFVVVWSFALFGLFASTLLVFVSHLSKLELSVLLLILGLSSSSQVLTFGMLHDRLIDNKATVAFGFNNMCICFGNAIFQGVAGFLLDFSQHYMVASHEAIHIYSVSDYRRMMLLMPSCYFLVLLIGCATWANFKTNFLE